MLYSLDTLSLNLVVNLLGARCMIFSWIQRGSIIKKGPVQALFTGSVEFAVVNNRKTDMSPGSAGCCHAPRQQ